MTFWHQLSLTIVGALLVVGLGVLVYWQQREYERAQQRYLTDGADAFGEQVGYLFSVFFANYQRALWLVRMLRDTGRTMRRDLLEEAAFYRLGPQAFDQTAQYRVRELIGSSLYSEVYERIHARVAIANDFIVLDLVNGLRYWLDPPADEAADFVEGWRNLTAAEIYEYSFDRLRAYNEEVNGYFQLRALSQLLSAELAVGRFSMRRIRRFRERKLVAELSQQLSKMRDSLDSDD